MAAPAERRSDDQRWVAKVVRAGVACTIPFQLTHIGLISLRFTRFAHPVLPILATDLMLTFAALWWTFTPSFARRWQLVVFSWGLALVASACSISVITGQSTALYVALVMMLFGTAAFAPWGAIWEAAFIALALAAAIGSSRFGRGSDAFEPYRLLELITASGISLFIAGLTQRYREEMANRIDDLRANEDKFWRVFDANPDAISIIRLSDERYLNVNVELLRSGYTHAELIGRTEAELQLWVSEAQRQEYWRALRATGHVRLMEAQFRLKNGQSVTCQISGVVAELSAGRCAIAVLRNIEKLKQAERAINAAREAAEAASRSKTDFLSNMSHEIRTPMNAILGMAEVIAESPLTIEQRKYLNIMINNGSALLDLINDILDFARVESGRLRLERVSFDLLELVERVAETFAIRVHQKNLELLVNVAADCPPSLIGDPLRLRQILVNLLGNALKFTEQGEIILEVRTAGAPNKLHFSVSDTGVGIPPQSREQIFASFTQAESSTARRFGGTGLGLAIVSQLTELMGGRIWVDSAVGVGSTFHFVLELELPERIQRESPRPALDGTAVLVIDDNESARRLTAEALSAGGARVMAEASPLAALDSVRQGGYFDVVLIDGRIPEVDSFQAIEQLLEAGVENSKVIPMLNANDLNVWLPRLRKLGLMHHLIKPVRRSELFGTVQNLAVKMSAAAPEAPAALRLTTHAPARVESREERSVERPLRVLVADDSSDNRLLINVFLKKAGYLLEEATNGLEALQKFKQGAFDIVLLDIQMPVMDGYTAAREIRAWETATGVARTPIIALTASVLDEAVGKSFESGCDTHVSKPVRRNVLISAIREMTAATRLEAESVSENAVETRGTAARPNRRRASRP